MGTRARARAFTATAFVVLAASLLAAAPVQGAPGDLDASFSGDGIQLTEFGGSSEGGSGVALQGDGKILVAGTTLSYDDAGNYVSELALARLNGDGSLDTSFSGDGKQITGFGAGTVATAHAVAIQPDGKVVVAGSVRSGVAEWDFALARYRADGSLDTSFAGDGTVTTDLGGRESGWSVTVQGDKIVVAGSATDGLALARYRADGSLDDSFSGDGAVTTALGGSGYSVAIQADGRIVVAGGSGLARFLADGSLDSSFSGDGTAAMGAIDARSVAIAADGRIVVAGAIVIEGGLAHNDFAIARYTSDGALDTSFGPGGMRTTDFGGGYAMDEVAAAVALQPDGKIVAVGTSTPVDWVWEGSAIVLARYATNGSLDPSFADGGKRVTTHGVDNSGAAAAIQADGKIVVAGSGSDPGEGASRALLARYQAASTAGTAPANSTPPTISGTAIEGQALTVNPGAWTGSAPINRSYRWRRCDSAGANCVEIAAATATTYTPIAADVGHTIRARETVANPYGSGSVDSGATRAITARVGSITGTVRRAGTNAAIARAAVNCAGGYSATAVGDGTYSIPNVAPGSYSCTASANGYAPATRTVTVTSGQTTTANFSLARN